MIDLDRLLNDPATAGTFHIAERLAESPGGSLYEITSTGRPSLRLFTMNREDAEYFTDIANVAASQLEPRPATVVPTTIARAVAIGAELHAKRQQLADLEAAGGDLSLGRSPQQHVMAGVAESTQHDELTSAIRVLEAELAGMEAR